MRAVDPRLFRYTRSTRRFLGLSVGLGALTAVLVIVQAFVLAGVVVAAFQDGADLRSVRGPLVLLLGIVMARGTMAWLTERNAHRASALAKFELRGAALDHLHRLGPVWLTGTRSGELTTLLTRGIDALDAYFSRYLPQLVLACIVPVAVIVAILTQDPLSALLVAVTVPLIPLFMVVIGSFTRRQVDRQWATLATLSGHFLDVVAGLPTLKVFGRARAQATSIADVGQRYRRSTMGVLRVSFLSALTLEFVATLSVALVAVAIGLRLVYGGMTLQAGLTALLLAPEAYLPIRLVGQHYHAAAEGVGAADAVFELLEAQPPARGTRMDVPDLTHATLRVDDLVVRYPGRPEAAVAGLNLVLDPGTVTALVGSSGSGKSTCLAALLLFAAADSGSISLQDGGQHAVAVSDLDPETWRTHVSYLPQSPYLPAGTLREAVRLSAPEAAETEVNSALAAAGLDLTDAEVRATLPAGLDTRVGEGGVGLSAGQIRRVALARTLCRPAELVLLDEPSAALDGPTEDLVVDVVRRLRDEGRTVVVVAHRPALVGLADQVVVMPDPGGRAEPGSQLQEEALASMVPPAPAWTEKA